MNAVATSNSNTEQDGLMAVCMAQHQTGKELQNLKKVITRLSKKHQGELDIIIDVSKVETSDENANKVARTFFKNLPFSRMAVYGGSRAVNVGIKLILNLFISPGVGEVKLFKNESQARTWLASPKPSR